MREFTPRQLKKLKEWKAKINLELFDPDAPIKEIFEYAEWVYSIISSYYEMNRIAYWQHFYIEDTELINVGCNEGIKITFNSGFIKYAQPSIDRLFPIDKVYIKKIKKGEKIKY